MIPAKRSAVSRSMRLWPLALCLVVALAMALPRLAVAQGASGPADAWEQARRAGAYRFSADVEQTVTAPPTVLNVGRESSRQRFRLEGEADLPGRRMDLTLWSQGGSLLEPGSGVEVRVEGDRAYARQGGGDWQEVPNVTGALAPQGDFLAFLAAARDVLDEGPESRGGVSFTRYTFRIDGPRYAEYVRDQMQASLSGEGLPPGMTVSLPKEYAGMAGTGELWVGADGLPLRQVLHLRFAPDARGQQTSADVTVDFSSFGVRATAGGVQPSGVSAGAAAGARPDHAAAAAHADRGLRFPVSGLLVVLALLLCAKLAARRLPRRLYGAIAVLVIVSMVAIPLLHSERVYAYSLRQEARAEAQEARQQQGDLQRDIRTQMATTVWNPHADPLAVATAAAPPVYGPFPADAAVLQEGGGDEGTEPECDRNDPADDDEDGLTNGAECALGTAEELEDTDGDGVSDNLEVSGFSYNGQMWYTDPLEADTNKDGIDDGREWNLDQDGNGLPDDSDADGTPELFDRDNDGDGVPDDIDLSAFFRGSTTYTAGDPFLLVLDSLAEGQPTFVEFQLKPVNPDHLWYAFNVMDWPENDRQGQVQDADGKTYFDVDPTLPASPNDNGDVQLLPMLEIRMSPPDQLNPYQWQDPPGVWHTSYPDLEPYGIIAQRLNDAGDMAVYVPLRLVTEKKGDQQVAFQGKMLYKPAESWGNAHLVRLVWVVQALSDVCDDYEDGQCSHYEAYNQVQVVHSYTDDWTLTGLNVREDHGTDTAIIYEDPAVDDDLSQETALYKLLSGLDGTFLSASDCEVWDDNGTPDDYGDDVCVESDGVRDITIDTIRQRWDHEINGGVPLLSRWNIEPNILSVSAESFATVDRALASLTMEDTKAILDGHFTDAWSPTAPISPTLMFAREDGFRSLNLDGRFGSGASLVTWSTGERQLSLDLAPDQVEVTVVAGLNWAPFLYDQDAGEWRSYPIEQYWERVRERAAAEFAGESDPEVRGGKEFIAQLLYLTFYNGVSSTVQIGARVAVKAYQTYDKPLGGTLATIGNAVLTLIVNFKFLAMFASNADKVARMLYRVSQFQWFARHNATSALGILAMPFKLIRQWYRMVMAPANAPPMSPSAARWAVAGFFVQLALVGLIVGAVLLARSYLAGQTAGKIGVAVVVAVIMAAFTVVMPIFMIIDAVAAFKTAYQIGTKAATLRVLRSSSEFAGQARLASLVGLIIQVLIVWGIFLYAVLANNIKTGTIAFGLLLGQAIAATIVAILMFVISLSVIGLILTSIVALIDLFLALLGVRWTISGWLTQVIGNILVGFELAVNPNIRLGKLDMALVRPDEGYIEGAELQFSTVVSTTITHKTPEKLRTRFFVHLGGYTTEQILSTSFRYALAGPGAPHEWSPAGGWDVVKVSHQWEGRDMLWTKTLDRVSTGGVFLHAGINRAETVPLRLLTQFDLPAAECWWILIGAYCENRSIHGRTNSDMGNTIRLDVLPRTLDEFVDAAGWAPGLRIRDADGDGLRSAFYGGNDPDDTQWDTDGDGLSDSWEMAMSARPAGEGGYLFDPALPDTDLDGLSDGDEARAGTNPSNPDSDGDGITDVAELVEGWQFTYWQGRSLRIHSDPLNPDADQDGMDDLSERSLHTCPGCDPLLNRYHPAVWNTNPIGVGTEMSTDLPVVGPGQTMVYTTTVANNLNPDLWIRGDTSLEAGPLTGGPREMFFDLPRNASQALASELTAPQAASTQDVDLVTGVAAQLHTPSVWAWDPLLEGSASSASGGWPASVAVSAVSRWTVPYVVASRESSRVYAYSAGAAGVVGTGVGVFSEAGYTSSSAPGIGCNDAGTCLVAWSCASGGAQTFRWRKLLPTLQVSGAAHVLTAPVGQQTYGGWVASDGSGFLLAWMEGTPGGFALYAQAVDANGDPVGARLTLDAGPVDDADLAWAYDRYQVVWSRDGDLFTASVELQTPRVSETLGVSAGDTPRIAYDPAGQRALLAYRRVAGGDADLRGRILLAGKAGNELSLHTLKYADSPLDLAVSADPMNGGWVVGYLEHNSQELVYQAVAMDGSLRGDPQQAAPPPGVMVSQDLACAQPRPDTRLLFDENPGATTFADASGFGHDGACSGDACPTSGVGGKEGNAVTFDGVDDYVSIMLDVSEVSYGMTFWLKTTCQSCGLYQVGDNAPGTGGRDRLLYLNKGNVCVRTHSNETVCSSGLNIADGNWHFLAHTFGGAVGGQKLYVDGALRAGGSKHKSDYTWQNRVIVGYSGDAAAKYLAGTVDELTVYPRALSEGEVHDLYRAALVVYALDEPAGSTTFANAAHNGYTAGCSGSACPAAGEAGMAYASARFDGAGDRLTVANQPRTVAEYVYDFEGSAGSGWSRTDLTTAPAGQKFLGRFGNDEVALDLSSLPTHDQVEISYDLYVIETWAGNRTDSGPDYWEWSIDGAQQLKTTFVNFDPPYWYQAYPGWVTSPSSVTITGKKAGSGAVGSWAFGADTPSYAQPVCIELQSVTIPQNTAATFYWNPNYGGSNKSCDGKAGVCPANGAGMVVGSVRVWATGTDWRQAGGILGALGYNPDAVYHVVKTLDHKAGAVQIKFKGSNLEALDNESWGLDNVRVKAVSRNVPLTNSSFTISLWARRSSTTTFDNAVGQGERTLDKGLHVGFRANGKFTCAFFGDDLDTPLAYTDADWHHWACTYDAASNLRTIYRDGLEVAQGTAAGDYQGTGTLWLGQAPGDTHRFDGWLDEVAVWNQALTGLEIETLYQKVKVLDDSVSECARPRAMANISSLFVARLGLHETTTVLGNSTRQVADTLTIDDTPPASAITSLVNGQHLRATGSLVIGGEAGDNTYVAGVDVSVDSGPWQAAEGAETWSLAWDTGPLAEGSHTLSSRATDVVGNQEAPAAIAVILDRTPPQAALNAPPGRAELDAQGKWAVGLSGGSADPPAGAQPGSGVGSVEVLLEGRGAVAGAGWQTATLELDGDWTMLYVLPTFDGEGNAIPEPTGVYTVHLRPTDQVGNAASYTVTTPLVELDNSAPVADLRAPDPNTFVISQTAVALSGVVTDTGAVAGGVQGLEIAFRPAEQVDVYEGAVLDLLLDDTYLGGATARRVWQDSSGHNNHGLCQGWNSCPIAGLEGRVDAAASFDGHTTDPDLLTVAADEGLNLGAGEGHFSLAAWVWADHQQTGGRTYGLLGAPYAEGGRAAWLELVHTTTGSDYYAVRAGFTDAGGTTRMVQSAASARLRTWAHAVAAFDGETLTLYLDGVQAAQIAVPAGTKPVDRAVPCLIGHPFAEDYPYDGILDEVLIYARALDAIDARALYEAASLQWHAATLAQSGPGVVVTTWTYPVPADMEGYYEIALRGTDVQGNRNNSYWDQDAWVGEVDTLAPRNNPTFVADGPWYLGPTNYTCDVADMNLDESTFTGCKCPQGVWQRTHYHQVSPWYAGTTDDTQRLYRIQAACLLNQPTPLYYTNTVCDRHDRCTTVTRSRTVAGGSVADLRPSGGGDADITFSAVYTPTAGAVVTAMPFAVQGKAYADAYLKTLIVKANGTPFYTQNWPAYPLPGSTKEANWSTTLALPGEGQYILDSVLTDWAGATQATTYPITVTVDLLPPAPPILDTAILTTTHLASPGVLLLTGTAADTMGVQKVEVNPAGAGWSTATLSGSAVNPDWSSLWAVGTSEPDGATVSVEARTADIGGRTTPATVPVVVDLRPPEAVTVTLGYYDLGSVHHSIRPGDTVRDGNLLTIDWTPSGDGSGVAGYWVGWTTSPTQTWGTVFVPHGTVYSVSLPVPEAQVVYAHVVPVDLTGNRRPLSLGPVYVDAPLTPDVVQLPSPPGGGAGGEEIYHGWMESGCSQLGLSRRIPDHALGGASLREEQVLYASWDLGGLRLAWSGANWSGEGDLFLYLDTQPGGATQLYDPYGSGTTIYLPGNLPEVDTGGWPVFEVVRSSQAWDALSLLAMQADYLVWVEDAATATLYSWNGSAWVAGPALTPEQYRLTYGAISAAAEPTYLTDLYLQFGLLGIADPATAQVALLGAATEEEALHLWTALPELNLVDAAAAVGPLAGAALGQEYLLTTAYKWLSLGPGLCPYLLAWPQLLTGAGFLDRDLRASLSADPAGTAYALLGDELAWQWAQLFLQPGPKSQGFTFMDTSHRPLGQGQEVTYSLRVSNQGAAPAEDVQALVSAYYALLLPGGTPDPTGYRDWQVVDVGDVAAGETVTVTFSGMVEVDENPRYERCLTVDGLPPEVCALILRSAVVDAMLFDSRLPLGDLPGVPTGLPLEWMWADHAVDLDPPAYLGILEPGATVRPGETSVRGYAADPSGVPLVEVEVRDAGGASTVLTCPDAGPDDGLWACPWTVTGGDGDDWDLRVRAADGLGHVSGWSLPWHTTVVDTTPPTVTLSLEARGAVDGQVIGPAGATLDGALGDQHGSAAAEVCVAEGEGLRCEAATTRIAAGAPPGAAYAYDDAPPSPLPIDASTACGLGEIVRTLEVTDAFVVGDADLGFNATHPAREEIAVTLISPAGTEARVIYPDGTLYGYENYDVWLDDAAPAPLHVPVDDDTAEPYYDRAARPVAPLSAFAGESSLGQWQLTICDLNPLLNEGAYRRARLSLTPQGTDLSTSGTWLYRLRPPSVADGLAQTLVIRAVDAAGNRSDPPISLGYIADVVAPRLAVTLHVTQTLELAPAPVLAGTASDGDAVAAVSVRVIPPEGTEYYEGASLGGGTWSYTPQRTAPGLYALWVNAQDRAGNETALGPFGLEILPGPYPCHARVESTGVVYASADASAVQQAVDAAAEGDTVKLAGTCAGTQERAEGEQTLYLNRTLTLEGGYQQDNWLVPDPLGNPATLDAGGRGRVLYVTGPVTVTLEGLRLTGGDATGLGGGIAGHDAGGGVYAVSATLTISGCLVQESVASRSGPGEGGGLYGRAADIAIRTSSIAGNTASQGDRGWGGGVYLSGSGAVVEAGALEENRASTADEGWGGGLYAFGGTTAVMGTRVAHNSASTAGVGWGGGLTLYGSDAAISSNVIEQNSASTAGEGHGGGLYVQAGEVALSGNYVHGNAAAAGDGPGYGGGLSLWVTLATLSGESMTGNVASWSGDGYGGGLHAVASSPVLSGSQVVSNTASYNGLADGLGGGLFISDTWPITLTNNFLGGNHAYSQGSELWLSNTQASTDTVTLLHNSIAGWGELGLYVGGPVTATLTNTIIAGYPGAGLYADAGSLVQLEATLWHGNGLDVDGPGTVLSQTNVYGDPAFVDPGARDYHLGAGSAAVDRGVYAGVGVDIDGDSRPLGLGYDIGADEYSSPDVPITGLEATNDGPTLLGGTTTLTATVATGSNVTYAWAFGDGGSGGGAVVSHVYPAVGLYTAVVTASNGYNAVTATTVVTVTDVPVEGLIASNDSPTLLGAPTTMTATVTAGTNVGYTWEFGDGGVGSGEVVSHTYGAAGQYLATVTAGNPVSVLTATTPISIVTWAAPASVVIAAPVDGLVGIPFKVRADVSPMEATLPITYVWEATGQAPVTQVGGLWDRVAFTWDVTGTNLITVTAMNVAGSVTATHSVDVLPQTAHVHDIQVRYQEQSPGRYRAVATVRILSQRNKPVSDAEVAVDWALPDGAHLEQSRLTNRNGLVRFGVGRTLTGTYEICVTGVSKPGWVYDPSRNAETCDSIVVPSAAGLVPEGGAVRLTRVVEPGHGLSGAVVDYPLTVTNEGAGPDRFLLEVTGGAWPVSLSQDDTGLLEAGASIQVQAVVTVPERLDASEPGLDLCAVTATSLWTDAVSDTVRLVTERAGPQGVRLEAEGGGGALPGQPVVHRVTLTNEGHRRSSYRLEVMGAEWPVSLSARRIGNLMPGESATVLVTVTVPLDARPGDLDVAALVAQARRARDLHAVAPLVTAALAPEAEPRLAGAAWTAETVRRLAVAAVAAARPPPGHRAVRLRPHDGSSATARPASGRSRGFCVLG